MIFMIESLICCHFHILVGIFHYRTWLVYSNDGVPQKCPRSSWASKLDAHPLVSFIEISYIYSSSASVAWQSLLLMLTSIDGHLHSPLIILVNVRLSPFCLLHTIPIIIFYSTHSAISMAHAHVLREGWKSLRLFKYETIAWLVIGGIEVGNIFVWRKWSLA